MWKRLKPGDIVDVVAPSKAIDLKEIQPAVEILKSYGLHVRIQDDLIDPTLFCSNTDEYRWQSLYNALNNTDSAAVWAVAGGYCATRIIPHLLQQPTILSQKAFIGFSDITALHLMLHKKWGWNPIHGPVLTHVNYINNLPGFKVLMAALFGEQDTITIPDLKPLNPSATHLKSEIKGGIIGGNLSLLQTSLATAWQLTAQNQILFIEEVGEPSYKIDRMLEHLLQAGVFSNIKALVFGSFTECPISYDEPVTAALYRMANILEEFEIPVFTTTNIGHDIDHNYPVIYGAPATITRDFQENNYQLSMVIPE